MLVKASAVGKILMEAVVGGSLYIKPEDFEKLKGTLPPTRYYCFNTGTICSKRIVPVDVKNDSLIRKLRLVFYFPVSDSQNEGFIDAYTSELQILVGMSLVSMENLTRPENIYPGPSSVS